MEVAHRAWRHKLVTLVPTRRALCAAALRSDTTHRRNPVAADDARSSPDRRGCRRRPAARKLPFPRVLLTADRARSIAAPPPARQSQPPPLPPSPPPPLVPLVYATFTDGLTFGEGMHLLTSTDGYACHLAGDPSCSHRAGSERSFVIHPLCGTAAGSTSSSRPSCASVWSAWASTACGTHGQLARRPRDSGTHARETSSTGRTWRQSACRLLVHATCGLPTGTS